MLDFCSIAVHLQTAIVEKVEYLDQIALEVSSIHGNYIAQLTKKKIMDVKILRLELIGLKLCIPRKKNPFKIRRRQELSQLILRTNCFPTCTQFSHLNQIKWNPQGINNPPCFRISEVCIDDRYLDVAEGEMLNNLENIAQFGRNAAICNNKVKVWMDGLFWMDMIFLEFCQQTAPLQIRLVSTSLFQQVTQLFNVSSLKIPLCKLESAIFFLPSFQKIDELECTLTIMSNEIAEQIKAKKILFYTCDADVAANTANIFFQQWLLKQRAIESFKIVGDDDVAVETVFADVPYMSIWSVGEEESTKTVILKITDRYLKTNCENNSIYCIDRGDKNLLIFLGKSFGDRIIAMECTYIHDIVEIVDVSK